MLRIHFSPGEGCNISGTPAEMRAVAEAINPWHRDISFAADVRSSPSPYLVALSALIVRVSEGPIRAEVQEGMLCIDGGPEFMAAFAACFEFEDTTAENYHVHCEYFPGNEFVSPGSLPLVMSVHR